MLRGGRKPPGRAGIRRSSARPRRRTSGPVPPCRMSPSIMAATRPGAGQTALITGASYGIGVDLAVCFAQDGYDLVLSARSAAPLQEVAARLAAEHGVTATPIPNDLGVIGGGS